MKKRKRVKEKNSYQCLGVVMWKAWERLRWRKGGGGIII